MRTSIALAAVLIIIGISSHAMAETVGLNGASAAAARQDGASPASQFTPLSWRKSPQSAHVRLRQSRDAAWGTAGYAARDFPADDYQYWHQACCM